MKKKLCAYIDEQYLEDGDGIVFRLNQYLCNLMQCCYIFFYVSVYFVHESWIMQVMWKAITPRLFKYFLFVDPCLLSYMADSGVTVLEFFSESDVIQ